MKVLILGTTPSPLRRIIDNDGCYCIEHTESFDVDFLQKNSIDFAVSYRFKHIVDRSVIEFLNGRIINLHISFLPWNRGADPNLWSFLENTPKGVSIHYMDPGLDTGDIIVQKDVRFDNNNETLVTTYSRLNNEILKLFRSYWPQIRREKCHRSRQLPGGTYHRLEDKEPYLHLLAAKGWNSPVAGLIGKALKKSR